MLLGELRGPLLFGVGLFSLLTIGTVVLKEATDFIIEYNLPPKMFFFLVSYAAPEFIVLAIPMGALLGTLLAVGRLSGDREIVAMRTCGVSLYRVLAPYLIAGIVLSGITFLGNELVVPYCRGEINEFENSVRTGQLGMGTQRRLTWPIYRRSELRFVLVADEVEGPLLTDVLLLYFDPLDKYSNFMIEAEQARWEGNIWTFYDYRQVMLHRSESDEDEQLIFQAESLTLPDFNIAPESLKRRQVKPMDLRIAQLSGLIQELLAGELTARAKRVLEYQTVLHMKISIPFTPLMFIILAVPLAIIPQRSSRAIGMGIALLVVLAYYSMFVVCQRMGTAGVLPPVVAAWLPNAVVLAVGLVSMRLRENT
jgi:lipopolysaccharide export system permease protein